MTAPDWIAPDWIALDCADGQLHARGVLDQRVICEARSGFAANDPASDDLETALLALVADWLPENRITPVIGCGLLPASGDWSSGGWASVPCRPLSAGLIPAMIRDLRLSVHLVGGLKQDRPADMTCGQETRIAGFLALNPDWDGVICLPGLHSTWAHVSAGEIVSFQTFMTGQMHALLAEGSVLRKTARGWDDSGFAEGVAQGLERPERLMARMFSLHAEALLQGLDPAVANARLRGLLVGAELAAAKPYWLGQRVALIGADDSMPPYAQALSGLSVPVSMHCGVACSLAGLGEARALLRNAPPARQG